MDLFDRLSVVSFRVCETEETLLEDITMPVSIATSDPKATLLFLVPERKGNALKSMRIGNTSNAVLAPPISSGFSLLKGEV